MVDDDIYKNKARYEHFVKNLDQFSIHPTKRVYRSKNGSRIIPKRIGKYYCRFKDNLTYFKVLFNVFDTKDLSYVRRNRLINTFKLIVHSSEKDLKELDRDDINRIVAFMHTVYRSPKSKSDFLRDIKYLWKLLFPERDEKDRIDENLTPYPVRHLSIKIDKSQEKRRKDRLTVEEFEKLVGYFSSDPRIQFYLMFALECLGRPQEILYTKIKDVELFDNYAKINISEHGKEGIGLLQCIDSFPYLQKWLSVHPYQKDEESFLFVNVGRDNFGKQLTPYNIRKKLKIACKDLGINKPITPYSLKRSGVTFRRIRGDTDVQIQHTARWTSSKQLKTYDMSDQEDALKIALVQRGLLKDERYKHFEPTTRTCPFCSQSNGFNEIFCSQCKRPLDRSKIEEEYKRSAEVEQKLMDFFTPQMEKVFKMVIRLQTQIDRLKKKG